MRLFNARTLVFLKRISFCLIVILYGPFEAAAQTVPRPAFTPPPPVVSTGSVLQVIFSLVLVLALVAVVAWLLKRINLPQQGAGALKVVSGIAVGQRERIVLVEIKDTWLVVGVAPGQVRTLHTLPKSDLPPPAGAATEAGSTFQAWLKQVMEKRNAN
jgi:flagellar protein FliO/FliZ